MTEKPLAGCRIVVTRPEGQAEELCKAIEAQGGEPVRFPVIRISGRDPLEARDDLLSLPEPDIAIFVSANAVEHGLELLRSSGARFAAVGPSTALALRDAGASVDIDPGEGFSSEQLLAHPDLQNVGGLSILIVRGESGRELLGSELASRGAEVRYLAVYRREMNRVAGDRGPALEQDLCDRRIDCITIMSVETLENFLDQLSPAALEALRETPLVAPTERVIQTAVKRIPGISVILASGPRATDMLNAIARWRHSGLNK